VSDEAVIGIAGVVVAGAGVAWAVFAWWHPGSRATSTEAPNARSDSQQGGHAMLDIAALAVTAVGSFLVPYVKMGVEGIAEAVTDKVSAAAADDTAGIAAALWKRIRGAFDSPEDQTTIKLFEEDPDGLARSLTKSLEAKLREDESLARELVELMEPARADQPAPATIMQQAGVAGVINMPHADFRESHGVRIVAVDQSGRSGK
jgi:hypothetical protein